ncbi:MAG: hypothetical protein P0S96_04875 [Simkaniaceae bacterium]|nr:hypothetical protein [Candidatus Sacchlamyda saccharinae]
MSYNVPDNIFQNFCSLSQKVQKLENEVKNDPVTIEKRAELHKALENLQGSVEKLRQNALETQKQASHLFSQFEEMESQIISLYRKVEEGFEDHEISQITEDAFELTQSLTAGKMVEVAKKANELKHNVLFLFKHRRPSMQHRKIVHLALKLTDAASEMLKTPGTITKEKLQLIQLLKTLLREAVYRADQMASPSGAELAMDLYEIAELLYRKKEKEGRMRLSLILSQLSKAQQARLKSAADFPKEMVQILLEIADGDPCFQWQEKQPSVFHVMQA